MLQLPCHHEATSTRKKSNMVRLVGQNREPESFATRPGTPMANLFKISKGKANLCWSLSKSPFLNLAVEGNWAFQLEMDSPANQIKLHSRVISPRPPVAACPHLWTFPYFKGRRAFFSFWHAVTLLTGSCNRISRYSLCPLFPKRGRQARNRPSGGKRWHTTPHQNVLVSFIF